MNSFEIRLSEDEAEDTEEPDWGKFGKDYRLWRVKEAMAQAEKRLASQATVLAAYETRATSMIGWLSAEVLATVGILVTHTFSDKAQSLLINMAWIFAGLGVIIPAILSACALVGVFRHKNWTIVGADAAWLMKDGQDMSEVESLESLVEPYIEGIAENERLLLAAMAELQRGWKWFLATPIYAGSFSLLAFSLAQVL